MPEVLEAFTRLRAPATGWKLVVVDNGSTDKTREIVISFQARLPLSYLFEERAGKNVALNRGLSLLEGDLAVFTDDDAFPHPDWLLALRGSADSQSSYAMFGGVIVPRFEREPPYWLAWAPPGPCFSVSNPLMAEGPTEPCNLFGPNMAIRADVFRNGTRSILLWGREPVAPWVMKLNWCRGWPGKDTRLGTSRTQSSSILCAADRCTSLGFIEERSVWSRYVPAVP